MSTIGYVVIEFNQAGGSPDVVGDLLHSREDADDVASQQAESTAKTGRRERYAVAEVNIEDEDY